ncbi:hypothetical protein LSH36_561g02066 [Paralvinella palmiformis]|uniref:CCHC-type domain-containing protein n=1 Tax=Paralvinella palmiformis TaxID=53620 RepID=A0AAD9J766_9ANNE|nr:hypothetical protein LSH36_561g02066 [Paralvinella palmiformis]
MKFNSGANLFNTGIQVRSAILRLNDTNDTTQIPHLYKVYDMTANTYHETLITYTGRPPVCLCCRREGHIRADCTTPFCRQCRSFGYRDVECQGGYKAALTGNVPIVHEDDDMDEAAMSTIERTENKKTQENDTNTKSETEINIKQELSSSEEALIIAIPSETGDQQNNKIENEKRALPPTKWRWKFPS